MIEQLKLWVLGLAATALLLGLADALVLQKGMKRVLRLAGGILLIIVLLGPLGRLGGLELGGALGDYQAAVEQRETELRLEQEEELSAIIETDIGEYIWDKAQEMGLDVTVSVATRMSSGGVPIPDRVRIEGAYHEELSQWMAEELGIGADQQIWQEE